jgi:hypothetical protein
MSKEGIISSQDVMVTKEAQVLQETWVCQASQVLKDKLA